MYNSCVANAASFPLAKEKAKEKNRHHDHFAYEYGFNEMTSSDTFLRQGGAVRTIEHVQSIPLHPEAKVGFSILNMTGYPIRYLQIWEDGNRMTCDYLQHGERGLLNFIASNTLIRDNDIVEESFSLQTMSTSNSQASVLRQSLGHQVALQIAGYKWLRSVQADALGIRFEELEAVLGMLNLSKTFPKWQVKNALKLVTEVRSHNGGRMLQLSSTFVVKNMTNHAISLLTHEVSNSSKFNEDSPFVLNPRESFHVPVALLYRSVLKSNAQSLGYIWMAPHGMAAIGEELRSSTHVVSGTSYSSEPVDLMHMVNRTTQLMHSDSGKYHVRHDSHMQLSCELHGASGRRKKLNKTAWGGGGTGYADHDAGDVAATSAAHIIDPDNMPPKFCYSIEMESVKGSVGGFGDSPDFHDDGATSSECIYSIGTRGTAPVFCIL